MRGFVLVALSGCFPALVVAGPMVHHIEYVNPRAGQQGTTVEVTLEGAPAEKGTAFAAPGKPLVVERKAP